MNNYIVKFPVGEKPITVTFNFHSSHISYVPVLEVNRVCAVIKRNSKILLLDSHFDTFKERVVREHDHASGGLTLKRRQI